MPSVGFEQSDDHHPKIARECHTHRDIVRARLSFARGTVIPRILQRDGENVEIFKEAGGIEAIEKYREDCEGAEYEGGYGAGVELADRVKNLVADVAGPC